MSRPDTTEKKIISYEKYAGPYYSFEYPKGGTVITFDRDDGTKSTRLLGKMGESLIEINVEPWRAESPQEAAEEMYKSSPRIFMEKKWNVPPRPLDSDHAKGWRCIKWFTDGFDAPLIVDVAFVKLGDLLYRIQYAMKPEQYASGRPVFELVLRTFRAS